MTKRIGKAFVVGCGAGLAGELLLMLTKLFWADPLMQTIVSVLMFGILAFILIATGVFNKIAAFGGAGASIALCGLMHGAAMSCAIAKKSGASAFGAFVAGFWAVLKILGSGFVIALLLGLILH